MKTFTHMACQGDLMLRRIPALPAGCKSIQDDDGNYIVAHSETGHHHIIKAGPTVNLYTTGDPMVSYLEVIEATDAMEVLLEHLRGYDTHAPIAIPPGIFEMRRQREATPEGWRKVTD